MTPPPDSRPVIDPDAHGPGARLRAARLAAKPTLSAAELAQRLGVSPQALSNIESDMRPISLDKIHEVATAIGCDPHAIDPRLSPLRLRK